MELRIGSTSEESVKELFFEYTDSNQITVTDGTWSLVTFKLNPKGQLVINRCTSISNSAGIAVNVEGQILLVDE